MSDDRFWMDAKRSAVDKAIGGEAAAVFELRPDASIEDRVSANLSYIGRSMGSTDENEAKWQIIRQTKDAGVTKYEVCGSGKFAYKWSDRATLFGSTGSLTTPVKDDVTNAVNAMSTAVVDAIGGISGGGGGGTPGGSTAALQTVGNTSLSSINTKTPALVDGKVPVDGSGVTQPVSGTVAVSNLPVTQPISGSVAVNNLPATQPVSGTVSVANLPETQAVSGTFFPPTQPVSAVTLPLPSGAATAAKQPSIGTAGAAAVDVITVQGVASMIPLKMDGSGVVQPVSGPLTDAQIRAAALPVSGPLTDAQLRASGVPVTGTFFPATQPVSGPLTDTQLRASGVPVTGPMTDAQMRASAVPVSGPITDAQLRASSVPVAATGPTLTKGVQGATGFSMQQLKDAGRNQTNFFMAAPILSTATDTLMSLTGYKSGAAVAPTTTPALVTAGKTLRVTSITITYVTIVTTPGAVKFTLRANPSGVVLIGSPAVRNFIVGEPSGIAPVAGKYNTVTFPIPDGMEFPAGTGIGMSMVGLNAAGVAAALGFGHCTIDSYEY
jgi:hypothetical protein